MKIVRENKSEIWIEVNGGYKTVISIDDRWILKAFPLWFITGSTNKYIGCERPVKTEYSTVRERVYLHRIITRPINNEKVDHIDGNPFNNRRENLRICSSSQNSANRRVKGKFKGVYCQDKYRKLSKPHAAYISYIDAKSRGQAKRKYLGYFATAEEAARAYDKAAKAIWGEFAYLNFPEK